MLPLAISDEPRNEKEHLASRRASREATVGTGGDSATLAVVPPPAARGPFAN